MLLCTEEFLILFCGWISTSVNFKVVCGCLVWSLFVTNFSDRLPCIVPVPVVVAVVMSSGHVHRL